MPRRRRITAQDLLDLRIPTAAALSPDGASIAYALKTADARGNRYRSHLHLVPARGGRPRRLTRGDGLDAEPCWSPDGRHLAFVSRRADEIPQIWVLPMSGGEAWPLTRLAGGGVRDLRWAPNGRAILFLHRRDPRVDPERRKLRPTARYITRLRYKLDGEGFWPADAWHIYKAAFPSGRVTQLTRGESDDAGAAWSPDGRSVAFTSNRRPDAELDVDNSDLFVVSADGRDLRRLTRRYGPVAAPAWSLDGRHLYYIGHYGGRGEWLRHPRHVYRISARGGAPRDLTPALDQWPSNHVLSDTANSSAEVILPFREGRGERLAILVNECGACTLHSLPAEGGPLRLEFGGRVNVLGVSLRPADGRAAVAAATMQDAGDLYTLTLGRGEPPRRLTRLNAPLFGRLALTEPEERMFTGRGNGGAAIHGWILKPPGLRAGRRYPLVLNIHGGPMAQFGYTFFHEMHFLAAQGYVVVYANPRGSSGYGLRFMNCIENRWGQLDYADLMMVADVAAGLPYVDRRRMAVMGGSYGGFMTTWIVGRTNRFRTAITERQVGNMLTQAGASDLGFYRFYARGAAPWERPGDYLRDSPNLYAARTRTPLLIIHSDQDLRCPIAQSEELFTYLRVQGKPVEMLRFEGESHGLSRGGRPQNRLERLRRIREWLARTL
ncbi:MAG: S9 family peptidase [Candidatus Eisenbacteria bacterium]|uniref:S9 family peptidase n=1 Tax=Eiseniibacteriota bacterium TaxID=2212470 RepID=A0A937XB67_UNCEI|nr:S9 family peptidase [Candidatus Eisenbacteria bacterium]